MTPEHAQVLAEIKSLLTWNAWLLGILSVMVVFILIRLLFQMTHSTRTAPAFLDMAQRHGEITDGRFQRYEERQERLEGRLAWLEELWTHARRDRSGTASLLAAGLLCLLFGGFATVAKDVTPKVKGPSVPAATLPTEVVRDNTARGWAAMRGGDHKAAAELLEVAGKSGDPVLTLGGAAEAAFYAKDYGKALELCDRLTEAAPGRAHYVRGLVYLNQRKLDAAREQLRLAVRHGESLAATVIPQTL